MFRECFKFQHFQGFFDAGIFNFDAAAKAKDGEGSSEDSSDDQESHCFLGHGKLELTHFDMFFLGGGSTFQYV